MCDEIMVSFTHNINSGHIAEMDKRQCKHYSAGHTGNTAHQCAEIGNRVPVPYHYSSIPQVQQVVAGQEHPVNETCQFFVALQQRNNVNAAIAVKKPAGTHCNDVSDKEIDNICQGIHDVAFYHSAFQ